MKFTKGMTPWSKGKNLSKEHKENLSIAHKGQIPWNKGKKMSIEYRKKASESHKGIKLSEEHKRKIGFARKGKKRPPFSKEWRENIGKINKGKFGIKASNWRGGRTPLYKLIRTNFEYNLWTKKIFARDNYTCQMCNKKGGDLEAHHHKKKFATILTEFLKEYDQFSPIEDIETLLQLAMKYKPFWDINNGITLCRKCHKITKHKGPQAEKVRKV